MNMASVKALDKVAHDLICEAMPDPNDERELSAKWLADRMRAHAAAIRRIIGMSCEDEGCDHYGTPHGHAS